MDFNIQSWTVQAAKNGVMGYVNVILPVAGTIAGVLIGIFVNGWRERRKQRQELRNLRIMLYSEVQRIRTGIGGMDYRLSAGSTIEQVALSVDYITETPIYDAYIAQLSTLNTDELNRLDPLYLEMAMTRKDAPRIRTKVINRESLTEDDKIIVRDSVRRILHYSTAARNCMERYAGNDITSITTDHIRRVLLTYPRVTDVQTASIVGSEPGEVKRIRAEMKAKGELESTGVDEGQIDDI